MCHETVNLFFDFVADNAEAFIIGVRELHGASPAMREALREVMDEFADDMAEDIVEFKLLPALVPEAVVRRVSSLISRNLFQMSLDFIGEPARRAEIRLEAEEQVLFSQAPACCRAWKRWGGRWRRAIGPAQRRTHWSGGTQQHGFRCALRHPANASRKPGDCRAFRWRDSAQPLKPRRSFQRFSSALVSWSKGWKPGR